MPSATIDHDKFDSIPDTIAAFRNGELIVVMDDPGRENEGDLIVAAQDCTAEKMAFLVRYSSGYVCAPIPPELTDKFELPQMVPNSQDPRAASFRRPGHILPLRAVSGGVRARRGHTEAAIDFCRLAGKAEAAAIGEIVDDGEEVAGQAIRRNPGMLRGEGCIAFARKWNLKVCTIEDLVIHLEKTEGKLGANGTS
ncbi:hypothetical protein NPX13_g9582 [Xylaria arbuscula]|uniref:3,4-dihydroxy-2-butanone-4-phosphate synthase n=1 Tax=Xylaria arbuscula TaxID=114810 RepID=A0A9W8N684_9PEZI|nr:hypothetical protein NPX13_g9582 [Xylaria arbuscula]